MSRREWVATAAVLAFAATLFILSAAAEAPGFSTGVAKLEDGTVLCFVAGTASPCISEELPQPVRRSLQAMLTRGFDAPLKAPCPQPICPQPICYERTDPHDWLTVPNGPRRPEGP